MLSASTEDYLKTIYYRQDGDDHVTPSAIAEILDVTLPTVSKTMSNLSERGFVERKKHKGVRLTDDGERVALTVLRRHRLLELYLLEHLDYDWTEVHEEADRLEHYMSDDLVDRIVKALDDPATDPHGAPIPTADLEISEDGTAAPLSNFNEGEIVVIEQVDDRNPEALNHLATVGITPGTVLEVTTITSFGMIHLTLTDSDEELSLSQDLAAVIRACPN